MTGTRFVSKPTINVGRKSRFMREKFLCCQKTTRKKGAKQLKLWRSIYFDLSLRFFRACLSRKYVTCEGWRRCCWAWGQDLKLTYLWRREIWPTRMMAPVTRTVPDPAPGSTWAAQRGGASRSTESGTLLHRKQNRRESTPDKLFLRMISLLLMNDKAWSSEQTSILQSRLRSDHVHVRGVTMHDHLCGTKNQSFSIISKEKFQVCCL